MVVLAGCLLGMQPARAMQVLKVGVYEQKPDISLTEDGRLSGIFGEVVTAIADDEGWALEPVSCHWAECLRWLQDGRLDLLPNVFYSEERSRLLQFHGVPVLQTWSQFYARDGHHLLELQDLDGRRIAVLEGSAQEDYLKVLLPALGIRSQLLSLKTPEQGFALVRTGQADTVIFNHLFGELGAARHQLVPTPIILQPVNAYIGGAPGLDAAVMARIDDYLREWQADPGSRYYEILRNWRVSEAPVDGRTWPMWLSFFLGLALLVLLILGGLGWRDYSSERRRLRTSERRLTTILSSMGAPIYIKDAELHYLYANNALATFHGRSPASLLIHQDVAWRADNHNLLVLEQGDRRMLELGERTTQHESLRHPLTGVDHHFVAMRLPLRNANGRLEGLAAILTDVTQKIAADAQTHRLTFYDALTDLPNRRMLISRLSQALDTARRGGVMSALLVLDIDGFRKINETRGYAFGDAMLREVARRLVADTRAGDTASRISADEFMILLTGVGTSIDEGAREAMQRAERVRQSLSSELVQVEGQASLLSASFGLTLISPDKPNVDALIHEATLALQRAREQGGDRIVFYERALQEALEERRWLEADLTQALRSSAYFMVIQPQMARDGRVLGAELLSRWEHPARGLLAPGLFIPIAEETGLIHHLTETTIVHACNILEQLKRAGHAYPVSVNISPKVLRESHFVDRVRAVLDQYPEAVGRLIFEITEGVLLEDDAGTMARLEALRCLGIALSIDDFGMGYSNLACLTRLPIHELKIDQSLIRGLGSGSGEHDAVIGLIVELAQQLGFSTVAEGVESAEQAELLYALGCDALQGYFLARPMPLEQWLAQAAGAQAAGSQASVRPSGQ
ncbi:MAG: EAL domain-containing protein [Castellaniella sp.]